MAKDEGAGRHRGRLVAGAVALLVVGAVLGLAGAKVIHHEFRSSSAPTGALASAGYGLEQPTAAAVVGPDLYVANGTGNSVTVVNASSGAHVATMAGSAFHFDGPTAETAVGPDLFVANGAGDSVTEIDAATRQPVRTMSGGAGGFADPVALAASDGELYVLGAGGRVTAVDVATGQVTGTTSGTADGFDDPTSVATDGTHLFVTNRAGNSVTELDAHTLDLVSVLGGRAFHFDEPTGAAVAGSDLWVTNNGTDTATEVLLVTAKPVRVVKNTNLATPGPIAVGDGYVFTVSPPGDSPMVSQIVPSSGSVPWMMCNTNGPYLFSNPQAAVVAGSDLWVVSEGSDSLTEMDADSGALIRTIS